MKNGTKPFFTRQLVERRVLILGWHAQSEAVGVAVFGAEIFEPKTATAFPSVQAVPPEFLVVTIHQGWSSQNPCESRGFGAEAIVKNGTKPFFTRQVERFAVQRCELAADKPVIYEQ